MRRKRFWHRPAILVRSSPFNQARTHSRIFEGIRPRLAGARLRAEFKWVGEVNHCLPLHGTATIVGGRPSEVKPGPSLHAGFRSRMQRFFSIGA
jgi:hypothetical protein